MLKTKSLLLLLTCLLILLVSCLAQEPIRVLVTPTPAESVVAPTNVPTIEVTQEVLSVPTASASPAIIGTPAPTVTFSGSIIGPEYTLPPTSTPQPTNTSLPPTEGISLTPNPLPTIAPSGPSPSPAGPQAALPDLNPSVMGIQLDPSLNQTDWNQAIVDIQKLGVKWLKVQVAWKMLQPTGPNDVTEDFRRLETYLETAYNNGGGLDILISVAKAPEWARSNHDQDGPPDDPATLANFITLMLSQFGQAIDAVEIWNEPNLVREWSGQPLTGQSYMKYFVPAYNAVNAYSQQMKTDPNAPRSTPITVITAGLAPASGNGATDDRTYLQQMYEGGLASYPDAAIGIHPYSWWNSPDVTCCDYDKTRGFDDQPQFFFSNNINDYRNIAIQNGDPNAKLWATEFGWATWDGLPGAPPQDWMAWVNECQQGNYIVRAFQIGQSLPYMGPMMLWNLNFAMLAGMVNNRDERAGYSLLVPLDPRERAAYWMLYDAIRPEVTSLPSYSRCPGAGS